MSLSIYQEYPLHLKRGDKISIEGRTHKVHSVSHAGRNTSLVSVETTTGTTIEFKAHQQVEVYKDN